MKHYTYFPGCSSSDGGAKAYGSSSQAVAKALDVDLAELEDWNCCGSTPYTGVDELTSLCIAARNLALAEEKGLGLVTPCSACYVILSRANSSLKEYPEIRGKADDALAAGGLEYHETVRVRHLLDVFANDIGYDEIAYRVKRELGGLKVAPIPGQTGREPGSDSHPVSFEGSLLRGLSNHIRRERCPGFGSKASRKRFEQRGRVHRYRLPLVSNESRRLSEAG